VNGDGRVDWEEFSSYIIEEGVVAEKANESRAAVELSQQRVFYEEHKEWPEVDGQSVR